MKEVEIDWNDNVEGKFVIKRKEFRIHGEKRVGSWTESGQKLRDEGSTQVHVNFSVRQLFLNF